MFAITDENIRNKTTNYGRGLFMRASPFRNSPFSVYTEIELHCCCNAEGGRIICKSSIERVLQQKSVSMKGYAYNVYTRSKKAIFPVSS